MRRQVGWIAAALLVCGGCGEDEPASVDTDGAGGTAVSDDDSPVEDDDDASAGAASSSASSGGIDPSGADGSSGPGGDTEDTGEEIPPPPATGIQIVHVTADQGVRIPIAISGALVEGGQRNAPIYQGRAMMIRGFYELDPGYEARDIYGILYVEQPDGTVTEYGSFINAREKDCGTENEIDCRYSTLPDSFYWRVEPEYVNPGMTYRVELFEASPGHEDDISDLSPNFPVDGGTMQVGVEDSYMKMRVVVVPFDHDLNNECPDPPDLNAPYGDDTERTVADFFGERLLAQNPADEVEIIVHDVVPFYGSLAGTQLLGTLQQMRFNEGAPPEYYYYGVARPCSQGPDFAGVAQLGGPTMGQAGQRVGWGVYFSNVGTTAETFVHEIGHEQGRRHVACSGEEAGVDGSYPDHPEGDLISYGIDVFSPSTVKVHTPSTHDYMTYCSDTWVSEWAYNMVAPWIAEISSWELGDSVPPTQPLLVGTVRADGTEDWYVTRGHAPEPSAGAAATHLRYELGDGTVLDESATWTRWEKSDDYNVIVPLPADFSDVAALSWSHAGLTHAIDRFAVAD